MTSKVQLTATMALVFLMTLCTLLPIECTHIQVPGLEHPIVEIKVTNNVLGHQVMLVTCFEGDVILNEPVHLAYHKSHIVLCRIRIMGVSCRCEVSSSVWIKAKKFSAYKYHRDHHLCVGDKCNWHVLENGVTLVDPALFNPFAPKHSAQGIKFYNWDDAM
ncbi:hypothetical protein QQ045_006753 [Rhodiola kirilowii]